MWAIFRILVALFAFCWRFCKRPRAIDPAFHLGNVPVELSHTTIRVNRQERVTSSTIRVAFESGVLFTITRERKAHRFLKAIGVSSEFETGDRNFDERLFLACDHPMFEECVRRNAEARNLVLGIFDANFKSITSDGKSLSLTTRENLTEARARDLSPFAIQLKQSLSVLESCTPALWRDRYTWRIVLIEAVGASFLLFAFTGLFESAFIIRGTHLDVLPLFWRGLAFSLPAYALLMGIVVLLMRGSARAGKIILESAIGFAIALPLAATQLTADINRKWDQSEAAIYEFEIRDRIHRTTRRRRGGTRHHYYVHINHPPLRAPASGPVPASAISGSISVDSRLYHAAHPGTTLILQLKKGFMGAPWIEQKSVRNDKAAARWN